MHDNMFVFSSSLQLLMIFVNEKLSSFTRFYETHKDFVDGLGTFVRSATILECGLEVVVITDVYM